MNEYTRITDYYDLLMTQGYYDYQGMVNAVHAFIKDGRKKILELGVGTGLLAEQLKALAPEAEFTGVDMTTPMLEIARKRLGEWGKLVEADVCEGERKKLWEVGRQVSG